MMQRRAYAAAVIGLLMSGSVLNPAAGNSATVTTRVPAALSAVASTADPSIAAAGDIACDARDPSYNGGNGTATACRMKYTSDLLVTGGYTGVLTLGDNMQSDPSPTGFATVFDPTWGRVKPIIHPEVGNHDYDYPGAQGYFGYFGSAAGSPANGYYSFNIGSWHLIALNSNCAQISGGCSPGGAEETWLRADLAAHPGRCILAFDHHARYSSGNDGDNTSMTAFYQALYDARADVLLSGHSHDYERFNPQNNGAGLDTAHGITQFVVGTGGSFFTGLGTRHPNSVVSQNSTFGVLSLTLHPGSYDWVFRPEAGKTWTDSGSRTCHARPPKLIQSAGGTQTAAATALTTTMHGPTGAGHLLVLGVSVHTGATNHITSVTDTAGNTWTRAGAYAVSGQYSDGELWYAANARPTTAITAHVGSAVVMAATAAEYSGIVTVNPLAAVTGKSSSGTSAASGSVTATSANELIVGFTAGHGNAQTMTVTGAGFTALAQQTSRASRIASVVSGYRLASAGSVSFTARFGTSMYWAAGIAGFRASGAP